MKGDLQKSSQAAKHKLISQIKKKVNVHQKDRLTSSLNIDVHMYNCQNLGKDRRKQCKRNTRGTTNRKTRNRKSEKSQTA